MGAEFITRTMEVGEIADCYPENQIVANNYNATSPDIYGPVTANYSLIGDTRGAGRFQEVEIFSTRMPFWVPLATMADQRKQYRS